MNETTPSVEAITAAFTKFTNSIMPELKQRMNGRLERGLEIAKAGWVIPYDPSTLVQFKVRSSDPARPPYMVDLRSRSCTCPDHLKGHYCKHRVAAQVYRLACSQTPVQEIKSQETPPTPPAKSGQAIIWACVRLDGRQIGYLNRHLAATLAPFFDACNRLVIAWVHCLTGNPHSGYALGVVITFNVP